MTVTWIRPRDTDIQLLPPAQTQLKSALLQSLTLYIPTCGLYVFVYPRSI